MKKQILLSIALTFILAFGVKADPVGIVTVTIDDVVRQPGTVLVPVHADFSAATGAGVAAFDLKIAVNTDVLTSFSGLKNINTTELGGELVDSSIDAEDDFPVRIGYTVGNATPTKMVDKMFDLEFEYAGGYSDLVFKGINEAGDSEIGVVTTTTVDGAIIVRDIDATPITATFEDGSITQAPPIPIALWSLLIGFGLISLFTLKRSARNR